MKRWAVWVLAFGLGAVFGWWGREARISAPSPLPARFAAKVQRTRLELQRTPTRAALFRHALALVQAQEAASIERRTDGDDPARWAVSDELARTLTALEAASETAAELDQAAWLRRRAYGPER